MMHSFNRFALVTCALALALAACSQPKWASHEAATSEATPVPTSASPLPALPSWATPLLGKPLAKAFPKSGDCIGNLDLALMKYTGKPSGTVVFGWGYDVAAQAPVDRVVLTVGGKIAGAGTGGYERDDVPAHNDRVASKKTGWRAGTTHSSGPIDAWGLTRTPGTVCRLGHLDL